VSLYPPQIPYDLTRARTRTAAVGRQPVFAVGYCLNSFCLCGVHPFQMYLQSQLRLLLLYFSLFTTCFDPYGPSSGEIQYHTF
jgi:hypothetical protein